MPGNEGRGGGAEVRPFATPEGSQNNIAPFGLKKQKRLTQQLQSQIKRLEDLSAQVKEEQNRRDAPKDVLKSLKEVKGMLDEEFERIRKRDAAKLDRILKGKITRTEAQVTALSKRLFELTHPTRLIRVPRGTSQIEYRGILNRLDKGDKQAIQQYTVKKPKGYKTADQRQWDKKRQKY